MIFTSTSRACATRDGAITSPTEMLPWERDSSQVFLLYLCQLHSPHEKAISCSFCLPTSSAEPQFSITHRIRCLGKHREAQVLKWLLLRVDFLSNIDVVYVDSLIWACVSEGRDWINSQSIGQSHKNHERGTTNVEAILKVKPCDYCLF